MAGLRITQNVERSGEVTFSFDGRAVTGHEGESIAAALAAAGIIELRTAPVDKGGRGMFCAMGVCQECIVLVDGQRTEACRCPVRAGLIVDRVTYG